MTENVRLIVKVRINYIYATKGVKRVQDLKKKKMNKYMPAGKKRLVTV